MNSLNMIAVKKKKKMLRGGDYCDLGGVVSEANSLSNC